MPSTMQCSLFLLSLIFFQHSGIDCKTTGRQHEICFLEIYKSLRGISVIVKDDPLPELVVREHQANRFFNSIITFYYISTT